MPSGFNIAPNLKLEVEQDPTGLVNLIVNPSGEYGGYGWITPVAGSVLKGDNVSYTDYQQGLRYITASAAGGNYFYSEPLAVTAGQWVAAKWHVNYTPNDSYRVQIGWLNSSQTLLSSSAFVNFTGTYTDHSLPAVQAPAGTVYARIRFEVGYYGTFPYTSGGSNFSVRQVTVAKAATSTALANLGFIEPVTYTDILGPTHEIRISREDLNVGTLTATVLDASLDPAVSSALRPGRKVRVRAFNGNEFDTLFTGKATSINTTYDLAADVTRIDLTAIDNINTLSNIARAQGVASINDLPYLLEGAGVPWVVNDNSGQVASATVVSANDNASLLDQIAITRDSVLGYAWVDRYGVLNAYDAATVPGHNLIKNSDFETGLDGWTATANCTIARSTAQAFTGTGSMAMTVTAAGSIAEAAATGSGTSGVSVRAGATYKVTVRSRAATIGRSFTLRLDWYKADGSTNGAFNRSSTSTTTGWTSAISEVAPPAGTAFVRISVRVSGAAAGEVHYFDALEVTGPVAVLDETTYSGIDVDFDTADCINEVNVNWLRYNAATGDTTEIPYGPYRDQASINQWGARSATFTVQGATESSTSIASYAQSILTANATPVVRCRHLTLPIRSTAEIGQSAMLDLYNLVAVVWNQGANVATLRVTGVEHRITPDGWLVNLTFATTGSVAAPTLTPSPPPVVTKTLFVTQYTGTTDASGKVVVPHDLGQVPTFVMAQNTNSNLYSAPGPLPTHATSTTINVFTRALAGGAVVATGTSVTVMVMARVD